MTTDEGDYLPDVYRRIADRHPAVIDHLGSLGREIEQSGPLDERTRRLVKLAIAVGAEAQGAVRSNARKALAAGAAIDELHHVALLAITTAGFPTAVAAMGWIDEVTSGETT